MSEAIAHIDETGSRHDLRLHLGVFDLGSALA
jgi:hypothetical protein